MPRPRDDDDDDDYDRPRRRRDEDSDDDEDYRPRRRPKRRKAASGPPVGLIVALLGGVAFVGLIVIGLLAYAFIPGSKPAPVVRPAIAPVPTPEPTPPKASPKAAPKGPATPAPAANPSVTITAARRGNGFAGRANLEIDYSLAQRLVGGMVVVKIKGPNGTVTEANIFGMMTMRPGDTTGTWTIEQIGAFGGTGFAGKQEIWVERKFGFTGEVLSNIFTLE